MTPSVLHQSLRQVIKEGFLDHTTAIDAGVRTSVEAGVCTMLGLGQLFLPGFSQLLVLGSNSC